MLQWAQASGLGGGTVQRLEDQGAGGADMAGPPYRGYYSTWYACVCVCVWGVCVSGGCTLCNMCAGRVNEPEHVPQNNPLPQFTRNIHFGTTLSSTTSLWTGNLMARLAPRVAGLPSPPAPMGRKMEGGYPMGDPGELGLGLGLTLR